MTNTRPSLLVVDDSRLTREMFATQLEPRGYKVTTVASGQEAIQRLGEESFDLVLLDVEMPEMNGLEVLSIIRQTHSIGELPVIMVTGRDQSGDMIAAFHLGASDYVTKPLNMSIALARIQAQTASRFARVGDAPSSNSRLIRLPGKGSTDAPAPEGMAGAAGTIPGAAPARALDSTGGGDRSVHETRADPALIATRAPDPSAVPGYEILGELGRGGMGVVYKARHHRMNRLVALKIIDKQYLTNPDTAHRFYKEAQAVAQLSHPNIVLAYDAGEVNGTHYLAMEYIEGLDLARLVAQSGPLPVPQACDYIRQAALGLQHSHERGLVHRDIKPSNLLVTQPTPALAGVPGSPGGVIKILDLGMALLAPAMDAKANPSLTREGRVVGTVDYMAPEQWVNAHTVDIRADLYSLGCTFYFLLTGRVPFPGEAPMEKMLKHHLDEPAPLEKSRPDVPPGVSAVIRRLMAKRPEDRYRTPAELAEALRRDGSRAGEE
jgi:CheY-like chemotaxis protein/tRNA A-37 threonylcarbamoyl transferase component Bud32